MISRRAFIGNVAGLALMRQTVSRVRADAPFLFGLTPVFLTSDLVLLEALQTYLARGIGAEVRLLLRRTYQEITSQLVAGQIDAAWICGYPFVAFQSQLALVAVPIWRGRNTWTRPKMSSRRRSITPTRIRSAPSCIAFWPRRGRHPRCRGIKSAPRSTARSFRR